MADMLAWSEELQIVTVPVVRTTDRRKFICVMSREALEDLAGEAPAPAGEAQAARDGFDREACLAALRLAMSASPQSRRPRSPPARSASRTPSASPARTRWRAPSPPIEALDRARLRSGPSRAPRCIDPRHPSP
jgi:hypothetical protein